MAAKREHLAVHTGYKFYHNEYEHHTNHVLQLLTELYFELETFRELWAGKGQTDIFVEDILKNMESIQRKFEDDLRTDAPSKGVVDPSASRQGGKAKATHHPAGNEDATGYDASTLPAAALSHEQISLRPHLQSERRRRSPPPLKLDLRKIPPKDLYKPLTIKLPPSKHSASAEGSVRASNPPQINTTSGIPTDVRSETEMPKRSLKRAAPQMAEAREENPHNDASTSETGKHWVRQPFQREYTTRGPINADTPRHETSPKHSPILPPRYPLRSRRKVLYSEPQNSGQNDVTKRQGRKLKREGAFNEHDLKDGFGASGAKMESKGASVVPQTAVTNGKGKRRWDDDSQEAMGEGSRPPKRSRKY